MRNINHEIDGRPDRRSPWQRKHPGRVSKRVLVPWGCEAHFYDEHAEKFGPHGKRRVVLNYGEQVGAYEVLDCQEFAQGRGKVRTVTTSSVKIDPTCFPFAELEE